VGRGSLKIARFTGCFLTCNLLFVVPAVFIVSMLPTILRLLAWFIVFLGATFCWIVLIEHGPDDFVEGCKIEAANVRAIVTRVVSPPVTTPSAAATP
jgi:hypothetical protein